MLRVNSSVTLEAGSMRHESSVRCLPDPRRFEQRSLGSRPVYPGRSETTH